METPASFFFFFLVPLFLNDWTSNVLVMCYAMVIIVNLTNESVNLCLNNNLTYFLDPTPKMRNKYYPSKLVNICFWAKGKKQGLKHEI